MGEVLQGFHTPGFCFDEIRLNLNDPKSPGIKAALFDGMSNYARELVAQGRIKPKTRADLPSGFLVTHLPDILFKEYETQSRQALPFKLDPEKTRQIPTVENIAKCILDPNHPDSAIILSELDYFSSDSEDLSELRLPRLKQKNVQAIAAKIFDMPTLSVGLPLIKSFIYAEEQLAPEFFRLFADIPVIGINGGSTFCGVVRPDPSFGTENYLALPSMGDSPIAVIKDGKVIYCSPVCRPTNTCFFLEVDHMGPKPSLFINRNFNLNIKFLTAEEIKDSLIVLASDGYFPVPWELRQPDVWRALDTMAKNAATPQEFINNAKVHLSDADAFTRNVKSGYRPDDRSMIVIDGNIFL